MASLLTLLIFERLASTIFSLNILYNKLTTFLTQINSSKSLNSNALFLEL